MGATQFPVLLFDTVTRRHCWGAVVLRGGSTRGSALTVTGVVADPSRWRLCAFPVKHERSVARARAARQVPR